MSNSLRAKLSKLRHDGHITDAEYQAFIKKMDGHDKIRNKTIEEFAERLKAEFPMIEYQSGATTNLILNKKIDEITEEMKGVQGCKDYLGLTEKDYAYWLLGEDRNIFKQEDNKIECERE